VWDDIASTCHLFLLSIALRASLLPLPLIPSSNTYITATTVVTSIADSSLLKAAEFATSELGLQSSYQTLSSPLSFPSSFDCVAPTAGDTAIAEINDTDDIDTTSITSVSRVSLHNLLALEMAVDGVSGCSVMSRNDDYANGVEDDKQNVYEEGDLTAAFTTASMAGTDFRNSPSILPNSDCLAISHLNLINLIGTIITQNRKGTVCHNLLNMLHTSRKFDADHPYSKSTIR
jgi:hypothetical protein